MTAGDLRALAQARLGAALRGAGSGASGRSARGGGGVRSYSRKVPQQAWTRVDPSGRGRTVTCADTRGWTGCRWMACKRSGVRIPIAPQVKSLNRNSGQRVQQESTATANARGAAHPFG